ncbi:MAG TPA: hypothetical protein VMV14_00600 [Acidimicrobiales bacterium]|nr:hypothetical protein [Acidimicrobiales bacterium]
MRTGAKVLAGVLAVAVFGGLVVLAVAGASAVLGVLLTAVAVVAMIAMGNLIGGRNTPNRTPHPVEEPGEGTMEG